jgi:hypothetical protein
MMSHRIVMAGLVPAIHDLRSIKKGVDARHKAGMTVERPVQKIKRKH